MMLTAAIPEAAYVRRKGIPMSRGFGGIVIFGGHGGRDDDCDFRGRGHRRDDDDDCRRTKRHRRRRHSKGRCD